MYSQAVYIYELYETGVCGTGQELWDIDLFMNSIFAQKLSSPRSSLPVNWHTYLVQLIDIAQSLVYACCFPYFIIMLV